MKKSRAATLLIGCLFTAIVFAADVPNGITTVSPSSEFQGETVEVTMTLDTGGTPSPPPRTPEKMFIGTIEGTVTGRSGADCTATFTIPGGEAIGLKMCEVYFEDQNGASPPPEFYFQKASGFEVLANASNPVVSITNRSSTVPSRGECRGCV